MAENSGKERSGGIDMNVKEDDRTVDRRSGPSASGEGHCRDILG